MIIVIIIIIIIIIIIMLVRPTPCEPPVHEGAGGVGWGRPRIPLCKAAEPRGAATTITIVIVIISIIRLFILLL